MLSLPPAIVAGEIVRLQTRQHVVALTFDGGGNDDGAKGVLAALPWDTATIRPSHRPPAKPLGPLAAALAGRG